MHVIHSHCVHVYMHVFMYVREKKMNLIRTVNISIFKMLGLYLYTLRSQIRQYVKYTK